MALTENIYILSKRSDSILLVLTTFDISTRGKRYVAITRLILHLNYHHPLC